MPTYDEFVNKESKDVDTAYRNAHGGTAPAPSDFYHNAYRRLAEGMPHPEVIRRIYVDAGVTPPTPEPGPIPPVQPPTTGRTGRVRGNGFQFADDSGGWLPWGQTLFWAHYGFRHELDRVKEHFQAISSRGTDYVRVILTGLRKGTVERSVSPKDPKFQEGISGLLDLAYDTYGLRVQLTIFGAVYDAPSKGDREKAVDLVCAAVKGREHKVFAIEIANEGDSNGFGGDSGRDELTRLVARVAEKAPGVLVSPTCPERGDDITADMIEYYYKGTKATVQGHHYSRRTTAPDGIWRHTKKPWRESDFSVAGCPLLVMNQEPLGPESSGAETNDPLVLATDAAVSWLSGVGAYLLHCGAGIYGLADPRGSGPEDDRPRNLWETVNYDAICAGIRETRKLLPANLSNFKKHKTNQGPFRFVDTPDDQLSAAYSATQGAAGSAGELIIQPVWGVTIKTEFKLQTGTCKGTLYNPATGGVITTFDRAFTVTPQQRAVLAIATRT